jgi:nitroreductase
MNTLDAILTRRSIRKFQDKQIPKDIIKEILEAAMYAPSAMNEQSWHFIVIDDKNKLNEISTFHPGGGMCKTSPVAMLVCFDTKLEKYKNMSILDCAAATQNILLAAHEKGIGSVWISIHFRNDEVEESIKNLVKLPKNIIPVSLVALGYSSEEKQIPNRFKKERIHKNVW